MSNRNSHKQFVVMTVGKTHSGKTSFGKKLERRLQNACVIETDLIVLFLKSTFPALARSELDSNSRLMPLKYRLFEEMWTFGLERDVIPILSNSNMVKTRRRRMIEKIRKLGADVILVFLNLTDEVLIKRIEKAKKTTKVLRTSPSFKYLLTVKQRALFEVPTASEADYFFEINDEMDVDKTVDKIVDIMEK